MSRFARSFSTKDASRIEAPEACIYKAVAVQQDQIVSMPLVGEEPVETVRVLGLGPY